MRRVPENRSDTGYTYYVTARLNSPLRLFADPDLVRKLMEVLLFYRTRGDVAVYGFAIMPDHVHLTVKPFVALTISRWMNRFKSFVAKSIGHGPIWQQSFWSEVITDEGMLHEKLHYVHQNAVRAGLVADEVNYEWSSARDYLVIDQSNRIDGFR